MRRLSVTRQHALPRAPLLGIALVVVALIAPSATADITIPVGGTLSLGMGGLNAGCTDLVVAGTLHTNSATVTDVRNVAIAGGGVMDAQSSTLAVAGDWSNAGTFSPGAGQVTFGDGCGVTTAIVTGQSTLNNVNWLTSTGKAWQFAAGSTQTVLGSIVITGTGAPLRFRSTVPGVDAFILPQGSLTRANLDNVNVVFGPQVITEATPVPSLSAAATVSLALLLMLITALRGSRAWRATPRSLIHRDMP